MAAIIQLIEIQWTKASRGAPMSALRNSVSETFPVNCEELKEDLLLHHVSYHESDGFQLPFNRGIQVVDDFQLSKIGLRCVVSDNKLTVSYLGLPLRLPREKRVGELSWNSWLRVAANYRIAAENTWAYRKYACNIFFGDTNAFDEIVLLRQPKFIFNDEKQLW